MGQHGGGKMGMHKHGTSARVGPSPRAKFMRALEDNSDKAKGKRPKAKLSFSSPSAAVRGFKPR
jgi:hypothetical protein